jgi:hypothetical protein
MLVARKFAYRLLNGVVRQASPDSQEWASAMVRELDFVESDWSALLWALGSTTALFRHSVPRRFRALLEKRLGAARGERVKNIRKITTGIFFGVVIATAVLTVSFIGLLQTASLLFPEWRAGHIRIVEWLAIVGVPEAAFMATAQALWRRKRFMAAGVLLAAIALMTHAIIHGLTHG